MPERAKRPCRKAGCPELTTARYCTSHQQHNEKQYDLWRGTPASRGYDGDWLVVREQALKRDKYLCLHCLAKGRATPAKDVDHIMPIGVAPDLRLDLSNLQSLCRPCHRAKHATNHLMG